MTESFATRAELLAGKDFDFPVTGGMTAFKTAAAIAAASGQGTLGV